MTPDEIRAAVSFALSSIDNRSDLAESLAVRIIDRNAMKPAIDARLFGGGAFAFDWEDVFGLSDAAAAASAIVANLPPGDAALVLLGLLELWRRLRRSRVPLSETEARVLVAIRHGCQTVAAIAASAGIDLRIVETTVENLKNRFYREEIRLVEGANGGFHTRF
jgi:hypothetical protein